MQSRMHRRRRNHSKSQPHLSRHRPHPMEGCEYPRRRIDHPHPLRFKVLSRLLLLRNRDQTAYSIDIPWKSPELRPHDYRGSYQAVRPAPMPLRMFCQLRDASRPAHLQGEGIRCSLREERLVRYIRICIWTKCHKTKTRRGGLNIYGRRG